MSMLVTPVASTDEINTALVSGELTSVGSGITITNVTYTGAASAFGTFDALSFGSVPGANLSLNNGVFLSTGIAANIPNTNTSPGYGEDNGAAGSDIMTSIAQAAFSGAGESLNASLLEIQFTPDAGVETAQIDLIFASDEFPEFSNSSFVDIGAVLINGNNVGFFNGNPTQPLSIIDDNLTAGSFIANGIDFSFVFDQNGNPLNFAGQNVALDTEFDGVSPVLTIPFDVIPGQVNTLTLAISDTGDTILDSVLAVSDFQSSNLSGTNQVFVDVSGTDTDDDFSGSNANELFELGLGADTVFAGGGNDLAVFGEGFDVGFGGNGADIFYGNIGNDLLYGNIGNDVLFGGKDVDTIFGGQDDDLLFGNLEADQIFGNFAADTIFGGQGGDQIFGGKGNDVLFGNKDNDTIAGNLGDDILIGGSGADVFTIALGGGVDVISDFNAAEDRVNLVNIDVGELLSTATVDQFGNTIVTFAGGGIIFAGVPSSDVTADIFI
ncbi:MAG: choice-of-anchor L domain-containing protein [Alphaproteobacteria bacterium]|nr:choice-of-anchor L domain-containing protein [Alphaproteobacteria bacterium SS10]